MASNHGAASVDLRKVTKRFGKGADEILVLDNIELSIAEGEFVAVIGPSGSGKSTLLNTVAGFLDPNEGQVLVGNHPVQGPGPSRCVVFQEYAVFPFLTVRRNIEFGLRLNWWKGSKAERREIVDRYLDMTGLADFADKLPKTLSGGMKQRVALARAYAVDPAILLMDEPFAALDAQTREFMQDALLEINRADRRTVMFVTHQVEEAIYLADRVIVLSKRPTHIVEIIDVPWGQERGHELKTTPEFAQLRRHVEDLLHH